MGSWRKLRARVLRAAREASAGVLQRVPQRPRDALVACIAGCMPSPYHGGELEVQRRAGTLAQGKRSGLGVGKELPRGAASLLSHQRLLIAAAGDDDDRLWVTAFEGPPGFLSAPDPLTVEIDARLPDTDPLASSLTVGAPLGLLAIDFDRRQRLRIDGTCLPGRPPALCVRVRSALENCPQYVRRRKLEPVTRSPAPVRELRELDDAAYALLANTDVLFIGSQHPERGLDVSHKAGERGFLRVEDRRHVTLPDYVGNGMFQTLGNVSVDPRVGLLVPDFEHGHWVQISGEARLDWSETARASFPGAQRLTHIAIHAVRVHPGRLGLRIEPSGRSSA